MKPNSTYSVFVPRLIQEMISGFEQNFRARRLRFYLYDIKRFTLLEYSASIEAYKSSYNSIVSDKNTITSKQNVKWPTEYF